MPKRVRNAGEFCWINILTPEPDAARDFFAKLLGWSYREIPGMGHLIQVDGSEVGGLFDINSPQTPPGTPPLIGVMVKVDNADATAERVKKLGGKAEAAFDIMENGRMAVCHDPSGANFDLWQAKNSPAPTSTSPFTARPAGSRTLPTTWTVRRNSTPSCSGGRKRCCRSPTSST
jgi:predicted enzyme related to lactoylglutathione lyase